MVLTDTALCSLLFMMGNENLCEVNSVVRFAQKLSLNYEEILCPLWPAAGSFPISYTGSGGSVLSCDSAFFVDGVAVVLSSPLGLGAVVTCTGTHELTAEDVDNLERRSDATVTAMDEYAKEVSATETDLVVTFAQVNNLCYGR